MQLLLYVTGVTLHSRCEYEHDIKSNRPRTLNRYHGDLPHWEAGSTETHLPAFKLGIRTLESVTYCRYTDTARLCVQTSSGAHPASCTMGTGGAFPGAKARQGREADHAPVPSSRMSRSYISSPPSASAACSGTAIPLRWYKPTQLIIVHGAELFLRN
jgi:hypothetical protein